MRQRDADTLSLRTIMSSFARDHTGYSIAFFVNSVLIATFYGLSTDDRIEWFYPLVLSVFVYVTFLLIRWSQYYPFMSRLRKRVADAHHRMSPATCEQREVAYVIDGIHHRYLESIHAINLGNRNNKHFLTQWIHNMKSPVSVIDLVTQRMQKGAVDPDDAAMDIREENGRLLSHLNQILSLLRLEDFSRDYLPEKLDLYAELRKVIHSKKNQFIYSNVFPKIETVEEPIYALSDAKWNEVILEQIISNAIKYSGSGQEPKVVHFYIEKATPHVTLKIRDEGIGIPEYDLPRVFEPFFTGENGRRVKNATGIGLHLCAVVAQRLGHRLDLQSQEGQGTEVTITYLSKP